MADEPIMLLPESALRSDRAKMRGHAAPPGSGPKGETCGTCRSYAVRQMAKTYRKCLLRVADWTGGPGTDIRKKDAACSRWEARDA